MVSNPEIVAKQAKAKQAKERAAAKEALAGSGEKGLKKRKQKDVDVDVDASETDVGSLKKKAQKMWASKQKGTADVNTDDDADKPPFVISAYMHVLRQTAPTAPPKPHAKKPEDEYLQFNLTALIPMMISYIFLPKPCPVPV